MHQTEDLEFGSVCCASFYSLSKKCWRKKSGTSPTLFHNLKYGEENLEVGTMHNKHSSNWMNFNFRGSNCQRILIHSSFFLYLESGEMSVFWFGGRGSRQSWRADQPASSLWEKPGWTESAMRSSERRRTSDVLEMEPEN